MREAFEHWYNEQLPGTLGGLDGLWKAWQAGHEHPHKHTELKKENWHSPHNKDGGCQMPYQVIEGYCCVCGTPNRSCQPEKQRTKP